MEKFLELSSHISHLPPELQAAKNRGTTLSFNSSITLTVEPRHLIYNMIKLFALEWVDFIRGLCAVEKL